ncbi:hypothetical protein [Legionella longbeachae]|uniref:hypothetical protein n=1 Tax=Legionella longbeachae TaxID=450 RepID=UPI001247A85E|nr:hypothetical protein [Legionella longbeachae]QEY52107.1 hypothetical protein FQU71_13205 [Legionella longbeachae]
MNFDQNMKKMKADLENLALKIPKFSQSVLGFNSPEKDWNVQINKMVNRYSNLLNDAEMSQDYFFAMANLEKDCSKMINSILSQLDHEKKLSTMSGRLNTLNDLNQVIKSINLLMSQHIDFVISNSKKHAPDIKQWRQLEDISRSIQINTNIIHPLLGANQAGINNLEQIAQQASRLILAALAKEINTEKGNEFINQIHTSLATNKSIIVQPSITVSEPGMAVSPVNLEGACAQIQVQDSDASLESRISDKFTCSTGDSSTLDVPITVPMEVLQEDQLATYMAKPEVVNRSLSTLIGGDLYCNNKITYLPFQVELLHELIHVVHNAQGTNFKHVPLNEEEKKLWHTYEEYVTMKGGLISEADFAPKYGALPRENHSGFSTSILFQPTKEESKITINSIINDHSALPNEHHHHSSFHNFKQKMSEIVNRKDQSELEEEISNVGNRI